MRASDFLLGALALLALGLATSRAAPSPAGPDLSVILAERPAETLAAYGLFTDAGALSPAPGVTTYDLASPLYSDGAIKQRYVFLPRGVRAHFRSAGAFEFPVGAVLVKTFAFPAYTPGRAFRAIETRLLIRKRDGWTAETYVWNAEGTAAHRQVAGSQVSVRVGARDIAYAIPNRNQCKGCHAVNGDLMPIGPSAAHFQLTLADVPSTLERWRDSGLIEGAPATAREVISGTDARARAYLDINCAHCHSPAGPANTSGLDLRAAQADPAQWGVRKRPIAAGRASGDLAFAIDPGRPERSILLHRMESTDPGVMMPELGRSTIDAEGVELVRKWISEMDADGRPRQN
ncbi:MAG: SO2930 family diheme c-type cytochrome [Alphaproteobacteria bacterium]|nr:SO2930 family diheme c-type cytochrome [Alphaproteobacteria bacterium]